MRYSSDEADVGDILISAIALGITIFLFIVTERRKAAVGLIALDDR